MIKWSKDKIDFLIKCKEIFEDREDILNEFNKEFSENITLKILQDTNTRFKLKLPYSNRRIKNNYKNLQKPQKIGGEVIKHSSDRVYIKINKNEYTPKQRYLYEIYNGVKLKKDEFIIFLNGDKNDFSKENLVKVSRYVNTSMGRNDFHKNDREMTLSRIKFCEWKENILTILGKER